LRRPPGHAKQRFGFRRRVARRNAQPRCESERRRYGHAGANAARDACESQAKTQCRSSTAKGSGVDEPRRKFLERQLRQPDGDPHDGFCCARRAASAAGG